MKFNKKIVQIFSAVIIILSINTGCTKAKSHKDTGESTTSEAAQINIQEISRLDGKNVKIPDEFTGKNVIAKGTGYYKCNFEEDRKYVSTHGIDITVGDNLYMIQINDWFMNFDQYDGKTVKIEGYYLDFDPYIFVGRYGPTCPYCTGGFVDFEILADQDLSKCVSSQSWVAVEGILRKGYDTDIAGDFCYIEATSIQVMDKAGKDTIKN